MNASNTKKSDVSKNTGSKPGALTTKLDVFIAKQIAMFKYAFAIDRALIHMIFAAVMFGLVFFTDKTHYLNGYLPFYHWGLLIGAGVQTFRACQHSLTPVVLLLLVGFGGQNVLHNFLGGYLPVPYLQMIAGAGVMGLVACGFYRLR